MKKMLTLITLIILAATSPLHATDAQIDGEGYGGIKWKTPVDQLGDRKFQAFDLQEDGQLAIIQPLPKDGLTLNGQTYPQANYLFHTRHGFYAAIINLNLSNDDAQEFDQNIAQIKNAVTEQLGEPVRQQENKHTLQDEDITINQTIWETGNTRLILSDYRSDVPNGQSVSQILITPKNLGLPIEIHLLIGMGIGVLVFIIYLIFLKTKNRKKPNLEQ